MLYAHVLGLYNVHVCGHACASCSIYTSGDAVNTDISACGNSAHLSLLIITNNIDIQLFSITQHVCSSQSKGISWMRIKPGYFQFTNRVNQARNSGHLYISVHVLLFVIGVVTVMKTRFLR
jgi:hypothetical protein